MTTRTHARCLVWAVWMFTGAGFACGGRAVLSADTPTFAPVEVPAEDLDLRLAEMKIVSSRLELPEVGRPPMVLFESKKPASLDARRAAFAKAKPAQRVLLGKVLGTELYAASKREPSPDRERALLAEAAAVWSKVVAEAGPGAEPAISANAIVHAVIAMQWDVAYAGVTALRRAQPDHPWARPWQAWIELRRGDASAALATLGTGVPAGPDEAVIAAWVRWANGDIAGAWQAMAIAASAGRNVRPISPDHLVWFAARGQATVDAADQALTAHVRGDPVGRADLLLSLTDAMAQAGRWSDAISVVDRWFTASGRSQRDPVFVAQQVAQAEYSLRGDPKAVQSRLLVAAESAIGCGAPCAASVSALHKLAQTCALVWRRTGDERYRAAAVAGLGPLAKAGDTAAVNEVSSLEQERRAHSPGQGRHDVAVADLWMELHRPALAHCYELGRVRSPGLEGRIGITIQINSAGDVLGVSTDPAGGVDGLSAVAACIERAVRSWRFPGRTVPGLTTHHLPLALHQPSGAKSGS